MIHSSLPIVTHGEPQGCDRNIPRTKKTTLCGRVVSSGASNLVALSVMHDTNGHAPSRKCESPIELCGHELSSPTIVLGSSV